MKCIAERSVILAALSFVSKYAEAGRAFPILTHVMLRAKDGAVTITSTNVDQGARDQFAAHIDRDGATCLPARQLLDAIKSVPTATEVGIDDDGKMATVLVGGKAKFKFHSLPAADFPAPPSLDAEAPCSFELPAEALGRIANDVGFAVDKTAGKYPCTIGISWQARNLTLELCATDTAKLALLSLEGFAPHQMPDIIVPPLEFPEWKESVSVSVSSNFIRLTCGHQIISSKLIDAVFLDYRRVFSTGGSPLKFDRAEMLAALNRVSLASETKRPTILFVGRDGKCEVSAVANAGEAYDSVAYDGDDFAISFAYSVIAPCLSSLTCETVEWMWIDHGSNLMIRDPRDATRTLYAFPYRDVRLAQYVSGEKQAA